mgnify:CR=1 FL=1
MDDHDRAYVDLSGDLAAVIASALRLAITGEPLFCSMSTANVPALALRRYVRSRLIDAVQDAAVRRRIW